MGTQFHLPFNTALVNFSFWDFRCNSAQTRLIQSHNPVFQLQSHYETSSNSTLTVEHPSISHFCRFYSSRIALPCYIQLHNFTPQLQKSSVKALCSTSLVSLPQTSPFLCCSAVGIFVTITEAEWQFWDWDYIWIWYRLEQQRLPWYTKE